jgi:hypothetical protein
VLEVRHASWFVPPPLDTIRGLAYSLAYIDLPPSWDHPPEWHAPTGPIGYLRLHGRNAAQWFRRGAERDDKYDYLYGPEEIDALARKAERIAGEHAETSVVTNNHFEGEGGRERLRDPGGAARPARPRAGRDRGLVPAPARSHPGRGPAAALLMETRSFRIVHQKDPRRVIRGAIDVPDGEPPSRRGWPHACILHGFKGFMDWGFFPDLARRLAESGIAAVRFNASGSGVGEDLDRFGDLDAFEKNTLSRELEDVAAVRAWICSGGAAGIDRERNAWIGHSRGGGSR